jgi:hypothetical protein
VPSLCLFAPATRATSGALQRSMKAVVSGVGRSALSDMNISRARCAGLLATLLTVSLSGCGPRADSSADTPPAPGAAAPAANQPGTKLVAWAPNFGPISQNAPPGHRWYQQVQQQQCSDLLDLVGGVGGGASDLEKDLYGGLADACVGRWAEARSALNRVDPDDLVDGEGNPDCLERATFDTLARLVDAHESEPDATVRISGRAEPTCQPPPGALAGPDELTS